MSLSPTTRGKQCDEMIFKKTKVKCYFENCTIEIHNINVELFFFSIIIWYKVINYSLKNSIFTTLLRIQFSL